MHNVAPFVDLNPLPHPHHLPYSVSDILSLSLSLVCTLQYDLVTKPQACSVASYVVNSNLQVTSPVLCGSAPENAA